MRETAPMHKRIYFLLGIRKFQHFRKQLVLIRDRRKADGLVAQFGKRSGHFHRRGDVEMLDRLKRILDVVARDGVHDVLRELVRAGGGYDDHGRIFLFVLRHIVACRVHRAGGVRVHRVLILFEEFVDGLHRLVLAAEIRPQQLLHLFQLVVVQVVHPFLRQLVHAQAHADGVAVGKLEQKALEVAGNEDVHRRTHRPVKFTALVVCARADEIGEDVVFIGRADEFSDGQPHALGVIRREDVAEIARGNGEVDLFAHLRLPGRDEVEIRRKIIGDLRGEPSEIDGVCGREDVSPLFEFFRVLFAREDGLDRRLADVEIAADGNDVDVFPFLRRHLQFLHLADAVARVKDHDLDALGVFKTFERGFARIAAGSDEDEHLSFDPAQVAALAQQIRQQRKRHILERTGGTVEQFEHVQPRVDLDERRGVPALELGVRLFARGFQPVIVVFVEIFVQDRRRAFRVAHGQHLFQFFLCNGGECFRNK